MALFSGLSDFAKQIAKASAPTKPPALPKITVAPVGTNALSVVMPKTPAPSKGTVTGGGGRASTPAKPPTSTFTTPQNYDHTTAVHNQGGSTPSSHFFNTTTPQQRFDANNSIAANMPPLTPILSPEEYAAMDYGAAADYYTSRGGYGGRSGGYGGGGGGGGGGYSSGGGGYGSGGGGGGGGGIGPGGVSEALTGFAKRYLPAYIQDVLDNPDVIARDVLDTMGFDEMGPLGNKMGQNAGYFVNQILPLLYAGDAIGSVPTAGSMVNRTAEYLQNAATPGGSVIDPMQILEMVLAESQKPATGTQTLGSSLFAGQSPAQQRSAMLSIIDDLANWLPNARFATGLRNAAMASGNEYVRQAAQATNPYNSPFGTFLKNTLGPIP